MTINSCVRMCSKPLLASVLRVKSQLAHTRRIETNNGFFVLSRVCLTIDLPMFGVDDKKPNVLHEPRHADLCKVLLKQAKWVTRGLAHHNERLIIELHHLVSSRLLSWLS
jgi:hypothetical protein